MEIRPLTEAEQKYTYRQSMQIRGQTGSIGILQGGYGADHEFHSDFQELSSRLNTDEFAAELQEVLCSGENSILQNLDIMQEFMMQHTRNGFPGKSTVSVWKRKNTHTLCAAILKRRAAILKSTVM